jgi:flagellar hook-basal body complex protein FliE
MTISPIGNILGAAGLSPLQGTQSATAPAGTDATSGNTFTQALENVQASQDNADALAQAAATGNLTDIHAYTIAATEASLTTELTVAVRDRAVESFNEIMRMQV